jgi:hypothetical protein
MFNPHIYAKDSQTLWARIVWPAEEVWWPMAQKGKVEQIVRSVLAQEFGNVEILSINITPDFDEDGDSVLIVKVVFDGDKRVLDARKTSGLTRHVLPKIEKIGVNAFPVFSFIAKSELGKITPDSA